MKEMEKKYRKFESLKAKFAGIRILALLIICQILSSLVIILPIILCIRFLESGYLKEIAYFSFATNLVIGFTKSVLITSLAIRNKENRVMNDRKKKSDMTLIFAIVFLQFLLSSLFLRNSLSFTVIMHLGFLGMAVVEYSNQKFVLAKLWMQALINYFCIILILALSLIFYIFVFDNKFQALSVIIFWSLSTILIAMKSINYERKKIQMDLKQQNSPKDLRKSLAPDYLLNYGLMQILYSFGSSFTEETEMIRFRILLLLSIPTNIVLQILSTTGLPYFFNSKFSKMKQVITFYCFSGVPLIIFSLLSLLVSPEYIVKYLGNIWFSVPQLIPLFFLMAFSAISLTLTSMNIKWNSLSKMILLPRIFLSIVQLPFSIFTMINFGATGILYSLILFNILFMSINIFGLRLYARKIVQ